MNIDQLYQKLNNLESQKQSIENEILNTKRQIGFNEKYGGLNHNYLL